MLRKRYKRIYAAFGLDQRDDINNLVDVKTKARIIAGIIFILILLWKSTSMILNLILPNYEIQNVLHQLNKPYEKTFHPQSLLIIALELILIFPWYGFAAYCALDFKNKMTKTFFQTIDKRFKRLSTLFLISYGIAFYTLYNAYSNFAISNHVSLNIYYFIQEFVRFSISALFLAAYYFINKYLLKNSNYKRPLF